MSGQVQGQQKPWQDSQSPLHPTHCPVEGEPTPLELVLGFPLAPGQGQAQIRPLQKRGPLRKCVLCPGKEHFAVKAVRGIFIPLIQPRQDLVHKFSRGNAFNKNLMGSSSSAESPYEFQVFVWSLAWAGAQLPPASGCTLGARTCRQPPASLKRGRHGLPGESREPLQEGAKPQGSGSSAIQGHGDEMRALDPQWGPDVCKDLKSVKE